MVLGICTGLRAVLGDLAPPPTALTLFEGYAHLAAGNEGHAVSLSGTFALVVPFTVLNHVLAPQAIRDKTVEDIVEALTTRAVQEDICLPSWGQFDA